MAKRPNPRSIKAARTYTILEAAEALKVSTGTLRSWIRQGLPALTAQRPFLILGDALRGFLEARRTKGSVRLGPAQLYCLTCKAARIPMGLMVDCIPQTYRTSRLMGLCAECGGTCNRIVSRANLPVVGGIFDVVCRDGPTA